MLGFKTVAKLAALAVAFGLTLASSTQAMSPSSYSSYRSLAEQGIRKLSDPSFSDFDSLRALTNRKSVV